MSDYKQTRDAAGNVTSQYDKMLRNLDDDDLAKRLRETTHMYQADCELKMKCAARIDELEALYEAAVNDAQEAEAYAEELEIKLSNLYDIAQDELKGQIPGPWPNAIRAVNYRVGTNDDGSPIWAHRIEQYHDGQWTAIRVFNESKDGTLEEEDQ